MGSEEEDRTLSKVPLPYGPLSAVVVTVGVYLVAQIVGFLVFATVYSLIVMVFGSFFYGLGQHATSFGQNFRSVLEVSEAFRLKPGVVFFQIFVIEAMTVFFLWLFLQRRKVSFSAIGLKYPKVRDIAYILAGFVGYFAIYIALVLALKALIPSLNTGQEQELGFGKHVAGADLAYVFMSLVLLPPIVEEMLVRGFLYTGLRSKFPKIPAALITSILFAMAHLQFGSGNALLWIAALDTFTLSMVLVYLRDKTDSLVAPIGVHMLKNGIAFMSLFILHL